MTNGNTPHTSLLPHILARAIMADIPDYSLMIHILTITIMTIILDTTYQVDNV